MSESNRWVRDSGCSGQQRFVPRGCSSHPTARIVGTLRPCNSSDRSSNLTTEKGVGVTSHDATWELCAGDEQAPGCVGGLGLEVLTPAPGRPGVGIPLLPRSSAVSPGGAASVAERADRGGANGVQGRPPCACELTVGLRIGVGHNAVEALMRGAARKACPATGRRQPRPDTPSAVTWCTVRSTATGATGCGSPMSPSTAPGRARSTAPSSWTPAPGGWSTGRSTPPRPRRWLPASGARRHLDVGQHQFLACLELPSP
jgi:hypothetical protein